MRENCNACNQDYDITTSNAVLHLFIEDFMANHVEAKCPCGNVEVIFTTPAGFLQLMQECKLGITLHLHADDALRARANTAWGRHGQEAADNASLPTYDLTERMEQDIAGFASSVEAMPIELFWTFIEDETNHDRPDRWV